MKQNHRARRWMNLHVNDACHLETLEDRVFLSAVTAVHAEQEVESETTSTSTPASTSTDSVETTRQSGGSDSQDGESAAPSVVPRTSGSEDSAVNQSVAPLVVTTADETGGSSSPTIVPQVVPGSVTTPSSGTTVVLTAAPQDTSLTFAVAASAARFASTAVVVAAGEGINAASVLITQAARVGQGAFAGAAVVRPEIGLKIMDQPNPIAVIQQPAAVAQAAIEAVKAAANGIDAPIFSNSRIFHFARMGNPMSLVSDALALFAEESSQVQANSIPADHRMKAWAVTGTIVALDAALLAYYAHQARRRRDLSQQDLATNTLD